MSDTTLAQRLAVPGFHPLPLLERDACELMTPGVTSIVETASLARVFAAFAAHRVHALLVVGEKSGTPLGWITARGLLPWVGRDASLVRAREAITEQAIAVMPHATGHEALMKLLQEDVTHVLVQQRPGSAPEGVVSELDLVADTRR